MFTQFATYVYTRKHTVKIDFYVTAIKIDKIGFWKNKNTHRDRTEKTQFRFDRKLFHATLITSNSFQKHLKPIAELMENKFCCQFFLYVLPLYFIEHSPSMHRNAACHSSHSTSPSCRRRRRTAIYVGIHSTICASRPLHITDVEWWWTLRGYIRHNSISKS